MEALKYILIAVGGYLLGSVNISIIVSNLKGGDVRKKGSGNAGATNMARAYGIGFGFLTLAGDFLKACVVMHLAWLLGGEWGLTVGGIACAVGHCFPVFYGFRGGKGISVGAAVGLAVDWRVFVGIVIVFLVVAFCTRKVSFGSVSAAVALVVIALVIRSPLPRLILGCCVAAIALFQHRANIKRLIIGTEPDFRAGGAK